MHILVPCAVQYISVNISIHMSHRRASATWAVLSFGAIPLGLFRLLPGPVLSSGPVESNNIGVIDYIVIFFAIFQSGQSELIPNSGWLHGGGCGGTAVVCLSPQLRHRLIC